MPQPLLSLKPHAPDVEGQTDHLGSSGVSEQGTNIYYQSQRNHKGLILAPQSLTLGKRKLSGSKCLVQSRGQGLRGG